MEPKLIFLTILAIVSLAYLVTLFFKEGIPQFVLKGCLVPLVLAVYLSGANIILLPIVLALVFGCFGDILLIKISNLTRFRLGLASFLIGHIFYIITMSAFLRPFNIVVLIISVIAAVCYGIFSFRIIQPSKDMKIPVIAYDAIILIMVVCALQLFLSQRSLFGVLVFAGSICFLASDTMLALLTFRKKPVYVYVMITYIAAQFLITLGFSLLNGG
jgi:uncharacterized membrane protein YhhN